MQSTQTKTLGYRETKYNWLTLLKSADFVALDTETNTLEIRREGARVNGFSICIKKDGNYLAEYFPVGHTRGYNFPEDVWRPILKEVLKKVTIFHNVNYDRVGMRLLGMGEVGSFYDTTQLCHLLNENKPAAYTLENCCKLYGVPGKVKSIEFEILLEMYGWDGIAGKEIEEYGEADAVATYKLWERVTGLLAKSEPKVFDYWRKIEHPNFNVLDRMEELGVGVDIGFCEEWEERSYTNMKAIEDELGYDPGKPSNLKRVLIEELGLPAMVNPKSKTGNPSFDKAAMERYEILLERMSNPLAEKILTHRGWKGAVTRYYGPYQKHVYTDGRIRPGYKSHGTVTGRFACSNPNLQQIPKETDKPWNGRVKECFVPMPGYELWEFDYSQLEMRLGAAYGKDEKLLSIFNDPGDRDIFSEMAVELGWERQRVKTFVYSINYGAGAGRIMDVFGCDLPQAKLYISNFYESYAGLRRANDFAKSRVERAGYIELWSGRRRHLENPRKEGYKAFNSLIQGGGADIVKNVMNRIARELPEVRMILQVHDSLWFELPTANREYYARAIREIMENPLDEKLSVVFKVDAKQVGGKALVAA